MLNSTELLALARRCVHCGMCLPACPTYQVFGTEMDAPRGRIVLAKALAEGAIPPTDGELMTHLDRCLACRACESACPSGVRYGSLIKTVRASMEANRTPGALERFTRWLAFRQMMPHVGRLKIVARIMWLYEAVGLQRLVRALRVLPSTLGAMEAILPPITPRYRDYRHPAPAEGPVKRGQVAFFFGCIQEDLSSVLALQLSKLREPCRDNRGKR